MNEMRDVQKRRTRRRLLAGAVGASGLAAVDPAALAATLGGSADLGFAEIPDGTLAEQYLYALPGKVPLIKKTFRPPNFETPIAYFRTPITRNDAFFVRWHLAGIPTIDAKSWTLSVGGDRVDHALKLSLAELKGSFAQAEITAVCQCSGNRRGLFEPHVPGVEWGVGAMGNAVWRGVRLKDLLARAGVKAGAVEAVFNGADVAPLDKTPDFVKSLPMDVALDENTLVAFEMNGRPLPPMNGAPARLVVPGWTGTYWVKQLSGIDVVSTPEKNFWMSTAYRVPRGIFPTPTFASQLYAPNEPITRMVVNSLITSLVNGQKVPHNRPIDVRGIAWDGGSGIAKVEVTTDAGATWHSAKLGRDLGRYSFREFAVGVPAGERRSKLVMARATSNAGETQVERLILNPAGYHHNVIQRVYVEVV